MSLKSVTVYTALYDLNRSNLDSRTFDSYISWLRATIELFPGIVVFHDGALEGADLQNCTLVKFPLENLKTFNFEPKVNSVLERFNPVAPSDITFQLPAYALLQFSKFEFAVHLDNPHRSVLWVDAGISRFIENVDMSNLHRNVETLLDEGYDALFEIDIKNNFELRTLSIKDSEVGSCRRVISGGSFWIRASYLEEIQSTIFKEMQEWLFSEIWDNEQVMLRKVLPTLPGKILLVPQVRGLPGCVPRSLSNSKKKTYKFLRRTFLRMLNRGLNQPILST
jgi:hypothetical protein